MRELKVSELSVSLKDKMQAFRDIHGTDGAVLLLQDQDRL